jgi:chromosome segregation ATPase
VLANDLQAL